MRKELKQILVIVLVVVSSASQAQTIYVNTASQLQTALNNALPGQSIQIADGYYERSGGFYAVAGIDGTAANPITVIGSRNAILSTGNLASGYSFSLKGNKHWIIKGFTVTGSKNGVVLDNSKFITVDSICAKKVGQDGIHLRTYTSYCVVKNCFIDSTGLNDYSYGEGIYIGSAYSNWCTYTDCNPDTSNYNQILNNSFGNFVTAENIDIKEGTKFGLIKGNTFNGTGLQGMNGGDSWIDAKGNYYIIENNTGTNSILDGFQTHIAQPGWGNYNTFQNNILNVNSSGYGIRIQTSNANGTAIGNTVCNNNIVAGAALGSSNVTQQTCSTPLPVKLLNWKASLQNGKLSFSWQVSESSTIDQFIIESSKNGISFNQLLVVPSAGINYSKEISSSGVLDNFFRLTIKEKNGNKIISQVIQLNSESGAFKIYKAGEELRIINGTSQKATVSLIDSQGKYFARYNVQPGLNIFFIGNLMKGIYFMKLNGYKYLTQSILI